jgi:hypothetical protein
VRVVPAVSYEIIELLFVIELSLSAVVPLIGVKDGSPATIPFKWTFKNETLFPPSHPNEILLMRI